MKNRKRVIALLLATALTMSGCGGTQSRDAGADGRK